MFEEKRRRRAELNKWRLKNGYKKKKPPGWIELIVRNLSIDPEEGCGGYFCIEHLSFKSSNKLAKSIEAEGDEGFKTEDFGKN